MLNLIITPVYKAYDRLTEMCGAIDKFSVYPFLHILADDDSNLPQFPVEVSKWRRFVLIKRDYSGVIHKNGLGQAVQLGYDFAHQVYINEQPNPSYDHVFLIESDVVVKEEWDKKMIDLIPTLPENWATLDMQSVDASGKLTYPTTISPRLGYVRAELEHMKYADFQCTLFNPEIFKCGVKFSDFPSHFDMRWSQAITEKTGRQHYRTLLVSAMHYTYSSRQYLNEIPKP